MLREIAPTETDLAALEFSWPFWARPKQRAPYGDWRVWLLLAGRGFGKSRTGAEWIRESVEQHKGREPLRLALVARTAGDVRDVVVEGESGILAISPPWNRPTWEPSKRRLTWPNGCTATTYSADKPDQLRGPQHHRAWCDELAAWRYPDAWDQLMLGLRLGDAPRAVVTTTPRPTLLVRSIKAASGTVITAGSTYENSGNLAGAYITQILSKYEGTRLGRQELYAEILDDAPGALWKRDAIDRARVDVAPQMKRVIVAIDPAVTATEDSDETGVVVAGLGIDDHAYILDDVSGRMTPDAWARRAVKAYRDHSADAIVAEVNNGGDMVGTIIHTIAKGIPYRAVRASRGKATRAEPVAALYEQHRVHHVGTLPELEDQLCSWDPSGTDNSPDRLDALVWALSSFLDTMTAAKATTPTQLRNMAIARSPRMANLFKPRL